jgi:hypothetical protein
MYFHTKVKSSYTRRSSGQSSHSRRKHGYYPSTSDEKALAIFARKVLRSIYGPIKDNSEWRIWYNYELYVLYEGMDIITFIKVGRFK